jgi:hypothetical protein
LVVFPNRARRQAPLSDVTGKPMARADIAAVRALVDHPAAAATPP